MIYASKKKQFEVIRLVHVFCVRCKKTLDEDTVNWTVTEDDENPKPLCADDRLCVEFVPPKMFKVREIARRFAM